jgi:hypothetical protein
MGELVLQGDLMRVVGEEWLLSIPSLLLLGLVCCVGKTSRQILESQFDGPSHFSGWIL